jgi:hypothetical protein
MSVNLSLIGGAGWQFFDNNGIPLSGGLLYTYAAGTTTPQATYTSNTGLTANTNPIVLNSAGRPPNQIWVTSGISYKFVLTTSTSVLLITEDNILNSLDSSSVFFTQAGAGAITRTAQDKMRETVTTADFGNNVITALASLSGAGGTLVINTDVVVSATVNWPENVLIKVENNGSITINNGVALGLLGDFEAGLYKVFYYVGTGVVNFSSYKCPIMHPEWWGAQADNLPASSTTNTAALLACNAAIPDSNVALQLGAIIQLPHGSMYIDNWLFTGGDRVVRGHGQYATRLIGVGAGNYTMKIFNSGRCKFEDFGIDGNGVKLRALEFSCTPGASVGGSSLSNMIFSGATTDGVYMFGGPPGIYDISAIAFYSCQFISSAATSSQVFMSGDNTIAISFYTCVFYGASPVGVICNAAASFFDCNWANNSQWSITTNAGQVKCYGCHSEGTGGFLFTDSGDLSNPLSSQHSIVNHAGSNTGVNTSGNVVLHKSYRVLHIANSYFNENIEIYSGSYGPGILDIWNNTFQSGSGYIITNGFVQGADSGGILQANNAAAKWQVSPDSVAGVGSTYVSCLNNNIINVLSASDVVGTTRGALIMVQNLNVGGTAIVFTQGGSTPVIMQQFGVIFVTAAPAAGEIQIKDNGSGLGVSFRAGATRNNDLLSLTYLQTQG